MQYYAIAVTFSPFSRANDPQFPPDSELCKDSKRRHTQAEERR
jgi:hypothetical protein